MGAHRFGQKLSQVKEDHFFWGLGIERWAMLGTEIGRVVITSCSYRIQGPSGVASRKRWNF